ncbi:hypothetical protein FQA39_LY03250 [Lamprigera yunnana]|nr:hypothetical protein FQA39_LY03250 [Lamprigera yunnana]
MRAFLIHVLIFALVDAHRGHHCNVYDLTWPYNNDTVSWGDGQRFNFTYQFAGELESGDWFAVNEFAVSEHGGTHLDAPYHFNRFGWKVGEIPVTNLFVPAIKVDVSRETDRLGHNARLLPKHLVDWERHHGKIPKNAVMLVFFDWAKNYDNKTLYLGAENEENYKFPTISKEAGEWIANHTSLVGVGVDSPSVDPANFIDNHKIFLGKNMFNLENVKIPAALPVKIHRLSVMPMNIEAGTGAPVRIVAFLDSNDRNLVKCNYSF